MESVKKLIDKRALHKREYEIWVNERQLQKTEEKVDTSKALNASLVDTESSGTKSKEHDTSNRSENDAHANDADIKPIYDKEPMAKEKESACAKPNYVIASSNSRNSSKDMPRFSSNDMVHNHYLEKAKNKTRNEGHRFSIKKTSTVHEKTMTPRSCLRWKPMGKIFKTIGLRWVPTGKIFTSSRTKVDSEPTNGSGEDITNQYEYEQTLDVSACTLNVSADTSFNPKKEGLRVCLELEIYDHSNEPYSSKLVPKVVTSADTTASSKQELDLLFGPLYKEFFTVANLLQVKMDDPNITMEECIRLKEERAHRYGKVYNWETTMYGMIWDNEDVYNLGSIETEFPAIVFNDTLTYEATLS
nr:hypothetical protein [Tanacetum cinerariifolium]